MKNEWMLLNVDAPKEIYGGAVDSKGIFYLSGGNEIWSLENGLSKQVYFDKIKLHEMWVSSNDVAWAVASWSDFDEIAGPLVRCEDAECKETTRFPSTPLEGIVGSSDGSIYMCGSSEEEGVAYGVVLRSINGTTSETVYKEKNVWFTDIWYHDDSDTLISVGQSLRTATDFGKIIQKDTNDQWQDITYRPDEYVYVAISGINETEIYIVGRAAEQGRWESGELPLSILLRWDGMKFKEVLNFPNDYLWTVWALDSKHIYIGGAEWIRDEKGTLKVVSTKIYRWDQKKLEKWQYEGSTLDSAVTGFAFDQKNKILYAYTNNSEILRTVD